MPQKVKGSFAGGFALAGKEGYYSGNDILI
jgi:hypothetical protein